MKQTRRYFLFALSLLFTMAAWSETAEQVKTILTNGRTWRVAAEVRGHLGVGESIDNPAGWWAATVNERKGTALYDDRITFTADGQYIYSPGSDGKVFCGSHVDCYPFVESRIEEGLDYDAAVVSQTATYQLEEADGQVWLTLPANTLFPYIFKNGSYQNPRFLVSSATIEEVTLVWPDSGMAWQIILTSRGKVHGGPVTQSERAPIPIIKQNLWASVDVPEPTFWFADAGWSQVADPEWEVADGAYTLTLTTSTSQQWQAQMNFSLSGITLEEGKTYALRCKVTTNTDVPFYMQMRDAGNSSEANSGSQQTVPASSSGEVYATYTMEGTGGDSSLQVCFDFGGNYSGTVVTISDIQLGEVSGYEKSDGETDLEEGPVEDGDLLMVLDEPSRHWVTYRVLSAQDKTCQLGDGFKAAVDNAYALSDFTIPEEVMGYTVVAVGANALLSSYNLSSLNIPETVTEIGRNAFADCSGLTSVEVPGSVKTIGEYAFGNDRSLVTVILHEGIEEIVTGAFMQDVSVENWVLPSTLKKVGSSLFYCWDGNLFADAITILAETPPEAGTTLFSSGWGDAQKTFTLYVPKGTKSLYEKAPGWYDFDRIIEIGDETGDNGEHSHGYFTAVNEQGIEISYRLLGNGTCEVGRQPVTVDRNGYGYDRADIIAYQEAWWKARAAIDPAVKGELTIPETVDGLQVVGLGTNAFYGCNNLAAVNLPQTLQYISSYALGGSGLKTVHIPANVGNIYTDAFTCLVETDDDMVYENDVLLTGVTIDAKNPTYEIRGRAIVERGSGLLVRGFADSYISSSVKRIGDYAFSNCQGLTKLNILDNVETIGYGAFYGCKQLASVKLPENLKEIGNNTFCYCEALESIVLPETVTTIGGNAFANSGIQTVKFPQAIERIEYDAFAYCKNLEAVVLPEGLWSLGDGAFHGCDNLRSVTLPSTLTQGGWMMWSAPGTFGNCPNLTTVVARFIQPYDIQEATFTNYTYSYDVETGQVTSEGSFTGATLYVPTGTAGLYYQSNGWYKFGNIVEGDPVEITPLEETTVTTMDNLLSEEADLTNTVVDNIYITVNDVAGDGYDEDEQCLVLNTTMTASQMDDIQGLEVGSDELKDNYNGLVFEVPAGEGTITVTARTTGETTLCVQVGDGQPQTFVYSEKGTAVIPYSVGTSTYVYVYAGEGASPAKRRAPVNGANSLRIYEMTWTPASADGIAVLRGENTDSLPWYTLQGQRVAKPVASGIYIHGGRKVVVR